MNATIRGLKANTLDHIEIRGVEYEIRRICAALRATSIVRRFGIGIRGMRSFTIDVNVAASISSAITRMPVLEHFCMNLCNLGDTLFLSVLMSIMPSLANKDTLLRLELTLCSIGDMGMRAIVSYFQRNNSPLQVLDLSGNRIGPAGATAIASLIAHTESLREVFLDGNNIGSEGAIAIAQAISQNSTVTRLVLAREGETFSDDVKVAFKTALYNDKSIGSVISSNHTLAELRPVNLFSDWWRCDIEYDGAEGAKRAKTIKFLNEKSKSLLSLGFGETLMAPLLEKIGRDCHLNAMFDLVRNAPDLLRSRRNRSYEKCSKRPRRE